MQDTSTSEYPVISLRDRRGIVTKLEAARALNVVGGASAHVWEVDSASGCRVSEVTIHARRIALGEVRSPEAEWPAIGTVDAATARRHAAMISLAAEIIELADMLAAE